ncbi:hypothetical protein EV426DRAFT_574034 [Tirmania nivea]|nr:hypothetical protein EV426DRAFT_574034 [Tirmania nivea]
MTSNQSHFRNVHFYDGSNPGLLLGRLVQNGSVTEANCLQMLGIILLAPAPIRVQHRSSGHVVVNSDSPLAVGAYDVYCDGVIQVINELCLHRIGSFSVSRRDEAFHKGILARDGKCVISGMVHTRAPFKSTDFVATHIFPLQAENVWIELGYGRCITDMDNAVGKTSKINSCQNGILLSRNIHHAFTQYLVSVNPDDNYKVVVFGLDLNGVDGKILDPVCRKPHDPHRVCDQLLRWHFRQSVLANMRGAGEPILEHDFAGKDMIKEIRDGPCGKEKFELKLSAILCRDG